MKTTKLKTTVFALATVLLTACGGDNSDPVPTPIPEPNQRVKSSNVKSTFTDGAVSIKDYTLTYNAENRLTNYQYLGGSPATVTDATITYNLNNKVSESMRRNFEYDADGKVVKITSSSSSTNFETTLTYDDAGKIIRAISKEYESGVENITLRYYTRFAYTNEKLTKVTKTRRGASSPSTTDLTYGADGNISRIIHTSSDGRGVRTTNLTYDNHNEMGYNIANNSGWLVNNEGVSLIPLFDGYRNRTKVFNQLGQIDMGYARIFLYAKNNVLTKQVVTEYDNVVNRTISNTYNYTYNSAKYPQTVNESYTYERTGRPTETATHETTYTYENY